MNIGGKYISVSMMYLDINMFDFATSYSNPLDLNIRCTSFTYGGQYHSTDSYTGLKAGYFQIILHAFKGTSSDVFQARIDLVYLDSNNERQSVRLYNNDNCAGKSFAVSSACVSSNSTINIATAYESYFTVLSSGTITYSLQNCTVTSAPSVLAYGMNGHNYSWGISPVITIRANSGHTFTGGTIAVSVAGMNQPALATLSADGKELTIDNIVTDINSNYIPVPPALPFSITANAISDGSVSITNNLTNCTTDNQATVGYQGQSYSATITKPSNYAFTTVRIMMNGFDVTSTVWNASTGAITIPTITGDIEITITATVLLSVDYYLTNVSSSNTDTTVIEGYPYQTTLTKGSAYNFTEIRVIMGGEDITAQAWNISTGVISIASVTGNLEITASASVSTYSVTYSLQNCYSTNLTQGVEAGDTYSTNLITNIGYEILNASVQMNGIDITAQAWNSATNTVTIATVTGNIVISALAIKRITINLYKNRAEKNRVFKSSYLTVVGTMTGVFKDVTAVTNPSIIIETEQVDFNYCHIPALNRYYFVEEIISVKNKLWQIRLKVDVLMTYGNKIKQQTGLVSRNQYLYNDELIDSERIVMNNPKVEVQVASTTLFDPDATGGRIIANVIGGD